MSLLDALSEFDAALEWPLDDPLLADEPPDEAGDGWPTPKPLPPAASAA